MNKTQITKSQLKKEILNEFDYLSPVDLIKVFELIFGQGEVEFTDVDWNN